MKSQLEMQLSDDLRQIVASQPFAPDAEAIERRGRRRSIAVRSAAGLGVAAGITAVAVAVSGIGSPVTAAHSHAAVAGTATGTATGSGTGTPAGNPPVETAAYVAKHVEAALGNAGRYIIRTRQRDSPGAVDIQWSDPRTGSVYIVQGVGSAKQASWQSTYLVNNVLHWRETDVDYASRTWFALVQHAARPIQGALPKGPFVPGASPAQLRHWLKSGFFKIVGHAYVNGHHTTEMKALLGPFDLEFWADSQTFQVVRDVKTFTGGLKGDSVIDNNSWLPRTAATVHLISHPQPPAGFTRVPAPK